MIVVGVAVPLLLLGACAVGLWCWFSARSSSQVVIDD